MVESGLEFDTRNILTVMRNEEYGEKIKCFYRDRRPSAIVSGSNHLTLKLLRVMQEMGLCCPEDISVVGFGDEEWCELLTPPLTTIKQDVEGMAEAAV